MSYQKKRLKNTEKVWLYSLALLSSHRPQVGVTSESTVAVCPPRTLLCPLPLFLPPRLALAFPSPPPRPSLSASSLPPIFSRRSNSIHRRPVTNQTGGPSTFSLPSGR